MHFSAQKLVFVHVPKTAGNYVSSHLLPFSDDEKHTVKHQDGKDRFHLRGPVTEKKHQKLKRYVRLLGPEAKDYRFFSTYRPPVERMISYYFSPHRWMEEQPDGSYRHRPSEEIGLDLDDFEQAISETDSLWELLDLDNAKRLPSQAAAGLHKCGATIRLLRFSHLYDDLVQLSDALGLPGFAWPAEKVNASVAKPKVVIDEKKLGEVREIVLASRHAKDASLEFDGAGTRS